MKVNWWASGAVLVLLALVVVAFGPQNAKLASPSGFIPETITVKRTMEDRALVCVEPPWDGLVQCKSVGELRKWMSGAKK